MFSRVVLALAASVCLAHAADDSSAKATALVQQLGDESFEVRRRASSDLLKMGQAAEDAVRKGQSDADAEVSSRCKTLLPLLEKARFEARLKRFLADTKGQNKVLLPGWEPFAKLAGEDETARRYFADLFRSQSALLESPDRGVTAARAEFVKRCQGLRLRVVRPRRDATLVAEVVALLVLACDARMGADAAAWNGLLDGLETLSERSAMAKEVRASATTRKLFVAVFRCQKSSLDRTLRLALALEIREASGLALSVATDAKMAVPARAAALVLLGKLGDETMGAKLLPLLVDETLVGTYALGRTTLRAELRDVALAAVVQLAGGKLGAIGFPYPTAIPGLPVVPSPACLGFANDAQRSAAFSRGRALVAKR